MSDTPRPMGDASEDWPECWLNRLHWWRVVTHRLEVRLRRNRHGRNFRMAVGGLPPECRYVGERLVGGRICHVVRRDDGYERETDWEFVQDGGSALWLPIKPGP